MDKIAKEGLRYAHNILTDVGLRVQGNDSLYREIQSLREKIALLYTKY